MERRDDRFSTSPCRSYLDKQQDNDHFKSTESLTCSEGDTDTRAEPQSVDQIATNKPHLLQRAGPNLRKRPIEGICQPLTRTQPHTLMLSIARV